MGSSFIHLIRTDPDEFLKKIAMLDKIKNKQNNNSKNPENQNDLSGVKKKKKRNHT